jgi:hypothetical protein
VLARFKHSRRLNALPDLPRDAMGKGQKKLLWDRFKNLFDANQ